MLTLHDFDQFISEQHRDPNSATRRLWPEGGMVVVLNPGQFHDFQIAIRQAGGVALVDVTPQRYTGPCLDLEGVVRSAIGVCYVGSWMGVSLLRSAETLPERVRLPTTSVEVPPGHLFAVLDNVNEEHLGRRCWGYRFCDGRYMILGYDDEGVPGWSPDVRFPWPDRPLLSPVIFTTPLRECDFELNDPRRMVEFAMARAALASGA